MKENIFWLWLSRLNLDPTNLREVLKRLSPTDIWHMKEEKLKKIFTSKEISKILNVQYRKNLDKYMEYMIKNKINFITIEDNNYPAILKNIENAPIFLYTLGNENLLKQESITIVGSRRCSEYGKNMSQAFSYLLAKNNITIVSGLAQGIDSYAHEGCLLASGKTIAVIATGIDIIYPKENKKLAEEIIKKDGLIISEYPLGTRPNKNNFPRRNRIISGLSKGVLVIEAGEKSGALITVNYALEQGKEVYVIPRKYYKQYGKTEAMNF